MAAAVALALEPEAAQHVHALAWKAAGSADATQALLAVALLGPPCAWQASWSCWLRSAAAVSCSLCAALRRRVTAQNDPA